MIGDSADHPADSALPDGDSRPVADDAGKPPHRARKRFGQHFLMDRKVRQRIVDLVATDDVECVIEIGPGQGALTDLLADRVRRLIAIELDRDLAARLTSRYSHLPSVSIVQGDVLDTPLATLANGPFALVGNVPYYITTPILFHALRTPRPSRAVFLVQKEVALRMTAQPGTGDYGALSVNLQVLASARVVMRVPPGAFAPPPKVDSAVVIVEPHAAPLVAPQEEDVLRELVLASFALRRKQMRRVLRTVSRLSAEAAERVLDAVEIPYEARPEELAPEKFVGLMRALARPE